MRIDSSHVGKKVRDVNEMMATQTVNAVGKENFIGMDNLGIESLFKREYEGSTWEIVEDPKLDKKSSERIRELAERYTDDKQSINIAHIYATIDYLDELFELGILKQKESK